MELENSDLEDDVQIATISPESCPHGYCPELYGYFKEMFSGDELKEFLEANETARPVTIRVNTLKTRRKVLAQQLSQRGVTLEPIGDWTTTGLTVTNSTVPIGATPEYLAGYYMLQSAASMLPVAALGPQPGEIVVDMAAAPGGKTTHIAQLMENKGTLFANDFKQDRCSALTANIHRLGVTNAIVTCMDGRKLTSILPKVDRVLLDAPCSGSGIISRDPSVKVKRGRKEFLECAILQKELLTTAIDLVDANSKTGGYIVYSTCSVSVEENEMVIDALLKKRNVKVVPLDDNINFGAPGYTKYRQHRLHPSIAMSRRYLPHMHNLDGFYVCKLKKLSNEIPNRIRKDRRDDKEVTGKVWSSEKMSNKDELCETVVEYADIPEKRKKNKAEPSSEEVVADEEESIEKTPKKKQKKNPKKGGVRKVTKASVPKPVRKSFSFRSKQPKK